eukprot:jgi/Sobl393_1/13601/SZX60317.1
MRGAATAPQPPAMRVLSSATLLLLLILLSSWLQPAASQGLDVSQEALGAGAQATATEFEKFEDALTLATLGGRGRGGRGQSASLGSFGSVKDLQRLQAAMYYLAGSSRSYESAAHGYLPEHPRDQKVCATCVAQAAATAVEMSLAHSMGLTMRQLQQRNLTASPTALYFCAAGGRTCQTGWDIPLALRNLDDGPQWLLPEHCVEPVLAASQREDADVSDWPTMCRKFEAQSRNPQCRKVTRAQPQYSCSYRSLSSFYEIQQHVRQHGAVITRLLIMDDFEVQLPPAARNVSGLQWRPYSYNVSAKAAFGHAALITGFDNDNYTWTILNSWGSGTDPDNMRAKGGTTADGLFRVKMGLLGVGTPDNSYGVTCEPTKGTRENLHGQRLWITDARRRPLQLPPDLDARGDCYNYRVQRGDDVASVVDGLGLDVRGFVQDAANRRAFQQVNFTY